ncbi:hypothetical protein ACFV0A_25300, partial [Streptomyces sp. NPDC059552]
MAPVRTLLSGLLGAALLIPVQPSAAADDDGRTVDYRGLRVTLPADWRVVDLDRNPDACVRLDLPTLYLGHAGTQAECTGRAVAVRADTLHLEPLAGAPERADIPTVAVDSRTTLREAPPRSDSNELRYALRRSAVMATVSYGTTPDAVRRVLARARAAATPPGPAPVVAVAPVEAAATPGGPGARIAQDPINGV